MGAQATCRLKTWTWEEWDVNRKSLRHQSILPHGACSKGGIARTGNKLLSLLTALYVDSKDPIFPAGSMLNHGRTQRGSDWQQTSPCSIGMVFSMAGFPSVQAQMPLSDLKLSPEADCRENSTGKAFMAESCTFSYETFCYFWSQALPEDRRKVQ